MKQDVTGYVDSHLQRVTVETDEDGSGAGEVWMQCGPLGDRSEILLSPDGQKTVRRSKQAEVRFFVGMSPERARRLAALLNEAADRVEGRG